MFNWDSGSPILNKGVVTEITEVTATAAETTIYEAVLEANTLKVASHIMAHCCGVVTNVNAAEDITIKIYLGTAVIETFTPTTGKLTDDLWDATVELIVTAIGSSGNVSESIDVNVGAYNDHQHVFTQAVDTESSNNFKVTVTWGSANAGNSIEIFQGYLEFRN